jgi:Asp-tRNA(Asn)/Glu-tRNA(Gln) amidotransferase B subunit
MRDPEVIAKEKGVLNEGGASSGINFEALIEEVLQSNKSTVDKIRESGKDGPIMFLVG